MHEPGEKGWPKGGFEVYNDIGGVFNYELDQVIVHPLVLGVKNFNNLKTSNRGRKPTVTQEEKDRRKEERFKKSGGKRGRPKKS